MPKPVQSKWSAAAQADCQYCLRPMSDPEDINAGGHEECRAAEATWHLQHPKSRNTIPCWICDGKGTHGYGVRCSTCNGTGREEI